MPDYKYKTSIVIGHRPDGRPIRKYIQDNSKMRFDAKVRQVRALTERGGAPGKTTVEEWAWQWFRSYKAPRVGASQRINYETHIRLRITPTLGALPITDVKPFQVQQLLNEARTDDGKPLGAGTAAQLRYIVRAIFEQAEINGLIVASPCRNLEMPVTRKKERRSLTHEEEDIVRKVAEYHYAGPWVLLMLDCGLRRGETVPIGWQDVKGGLLQISKSVEYKSDCNQPTLKDTKTAAGVRFVPLPDELAAMLDKKSRYFFHRKDGRMLTATGLRRMWASFHRACDRAAGAEIYRNKIITHAFDPSITPHYLRHTYCSNLRRQGVDLKTAQYLMGHSDIATTANIYSHVTEDDIRKMQEAKDAAD